MSNITTKVDFNSTQSTALVPVQPKNHFNIPNELEMSIKLYNSLMQSERKVHPTVALGTLFTTVSTITSRKYYSDTNCSSTLYLVVIAKTAMGKNMLIKYPKQLLQLVNLENKIVTSKLSSEGAIDNIFAEQNSFTQIIDEFGDELGHMMNDKGGYQQQVKTKMKALFSLTDGIYESGRYSSSGGKIKTPKSWSFERPCYGITGATTQAQLLQRLNENMLHDGFLNRFIILNGDTIEPEFPSDPVYYIPSDLEAHIKTIQVDKLEHDTNLYTSNEDDMAYDENKKCVIKTSTTTDFSAMLSDDLKEQMDPKYKIEKYITIPFSKEAKLYLEFIGDPDLKGTDIYNFCKDDTTDVKRAISGRWAENTIRLALALSAFEKKKKISRTTLAWCYNLIKQSSIDFMHLFINETETTKYQVLKEKAIQWFQNHDQEEWHSLSYLARNARPFSNLKSNERLELLEDLVDSQMIQLKKEGESSYFKLEPEFDNSTDTLCEFKNTIKEL